MAGVVFVWDKLIFYWSYYLASIFISYDTEWVVDLQQSFIDADSAHFNEQILQE